MLDLAPETEGNLRAYATRAGISVDELIARAFPVLPPQPEPIDTTTWRMPKGIDGTAQRDAIHALLALPKEEIVRRNAASIALLEAQLAEAENATLQEVAEAEAEWAEHKRRINESRALNGERLVYASITPGPAHE